MSQCKNCRETNHRSGVCAQHRRARCPDCGHERTQNGASQLCGHCKKARERLGGLEIIAIVCLLGLYQNSQAASRRAPTPIPSPAVSVAPVPTPISFKVGDKVCAKPCSKPISAFDTCDLVVKEIAANGTIWTEPACMGPLGSYTPADLFPAPKPSVSQKVTFVPEDFYTTASERQKIKAVEAVVNRTIQSQCFRDFMIHRKLIQTNGRTATQVADHLQGLTGVVPVKMYYRCLRSWKCPGPLGTSAVAYRQPPSDEINLNRAAFSVGQSDCEWAGTMGHESVGHSLGGYDHDFDWNAARSFSVPYSIAGADQAQGGSAFDACCKEGL